MARSSRAKVWRSSALAVGPFAADITGLSGNQTCFYRAYATNEAGDAWAPASTHFAASPDLEVQIYPTNMDVVLHVYTVSNASYQVLAADGNPTNAWHVLFATNNVTTPFSFEGAKRSAGRWHGHGHCLCRRPTGV